MAGSGLRAACGIVSAGLALGVAELVSVPVGAGSAPLAAIGATVVDHTPDGVREWAIDTFGTDDKMMLYLLMGVVALIVAALVGVVERTARPIGSVVLGVFGIGAAWAALERPAANWTWALPSVVGVALAIVSLRWLIRRYEAFGAPAMVRGGGGAVPDPAKATAAQEDRAHAPEIPIERGAAEAGSGGGAPFEGEDARLSARGAAWPRVVKPDVARVDRRQVMRGIVGVGVLAVAAGIAGRVLGASARSVAGERAAVRLPPPNVPVPPVDPAADLRVPGLASYLTPNSDFYRIDTALTVPQVSKETWSLRIHGMVDREIRLDYADLARRPSVERLVTLTCVSNPVGGDLIGNASWLGYRLDALIAEAGPHPDADMVLSRSADGFTAGSPLAALTDGRDALLAVGMNGEPLPVEHGYPARLVVPGLYGYVSATKWVTELEITRFDRAQAYWTRRGWSERGPNKTGTRIDTPRGAVRAGKVTIAGVAWAQHRGIDAVEVQIDNGPWQPARLAAEPSVDTWRQWSYDWDASAGTHTVRARATDGTGTVQTAEVADVIPDGASGYPSRTIRVG
ncbi:MULTISPECIES: molybdopterin-dependent oxidoreductase [Nocardia]|uniref:molybdopterin-dependent oxidoreductase n=1 Tax=Nocardia TaxID=1817 RepID=UPI0007E9D949|nr:MULTISPECIES: molybdopterin-dependent oxidoreductase [Nocardia]MBF6275481.1 molybdopterin-dependent oxidoreductase [Nocardia nova]OBA56351.1 oxidoreductase [Nocardia sp. 852002-51101_SCH5132738]OBB52478.1 oxidoreductase [Nocardia sp. 852002-51244_SCH5132740]OBF86580.1 oxidoreductase [Mycobacterium sp. 852002-51759_SCH5129042]